jgi:hypothetical protein
LLQLTWIDNETNGMAIQCQTNIKRTQTAVELGVKYVDINFVTNPYLLGMQALKYAVQRHIQILV